MSDTDPYTAKAEKPRTPEEKIADVQTIMKACRTGLLVTRTAEGKLHSRAMAPASKEGLVLDFIGNNNSGKFDELEADDNVNVGFYDTNTTDWVSVSGKAVASNDKNKLQELWNPLTAAWFNDLKDGKHDGTWQDPRVSLIEVTPNEIRYWKSTRTSVGQMAEIVTSAFSSTTAAPGYLQTLSEEELLLARQAANKA